MNHEPDVSTAVSGELVDVHSSMDGWNVEQLLTEAIRCIDAGDRMFRMALQDYRRAGEAFTLARDACPWGEWGKTLAEAGIPSSVACRYIRLAFYWDQIPNEVKEGTYASRGWGGHRSRFMLAMRSIDHLPKVRSAPPKRADADWVDLARQAVTDGATLAEAADLCGVSKSVVQRALNPASKQRERQRVVERKAARRALREKQQRDERDQLVKSAAGHSADAYAAIRRLSISLDRSIAQADNEHERELLRSAAAATVDVEDLLIKALRAR